jgi:antitoxin PrlF
MPAALKVVCTVDARGRVTVPWAVREVLGLETGNCVIFSIDQHNRVYVEKATEVDVDPVVARFLEFLARIMHQGGFEGWRV